MLQIERNYGFEVALMPSDISACYLCHRCASDQATVRNMRETIIPAFRTSRTLPRPDVLEALAAFEARFPVVQS
ncbi:MAG: hypothetical protein ABIU96_04055 [Rhodanobacter sp.]